MKQTANMSREEFLVAAFDAIQRDLGTPGLMRFFRETGLGSGDYTADRVQWLGEESPVKELAEKLGPPKPPRQ